MSTEEKLKKIFAHSLEINITLVTDDLKYNSIREWDSVAHMALISAIEDGFDLMLETSDIIDMSSFKKAKEIIAKQGVIFNAEK